jgi:hypothetical protein
MGRLLIERAPPTVGSKTDGRLGSGHCPIPSLPSYIHPTFFRYGVAMARNPADRLTPDGGLPSMSSAHRRQQTTAQPEGPTRAPFAARPPGAAPANCAAGKPSAASQGFAQPSQHAPAPRPSTATQRPVPPKPRASRKNHTTRRVERLRIERLSIESFCRQLRYQDITTCCTGVVN